MVGWFEVLLACHLFICFRYEAQTQDCTLECSTMELYSQPRKGRRQAQDLREDLDQRRKMGTNVQISLACLWSESWTMECKGMVEMG